MPSPPINVFRPLYTSGAMADLWTLPADHTLDGAVAYCDDTPVVIYVAYNGAWKTIGGGGVTPAALTKTDDTNVTLTLGGTPSTALLQATSLTLGWSGTLSLTRGGSGANLSATGGTSQFVRQNSAGAAFTVSVIAVADLPALNGFTDADWALDDRLPFYDTSATANRDGAATNLLGLTRLAPGGRLTLTSGLPVTTADVTGATTVYYTPYLHDCICLWDGTRWVWVQFSEVSLALGTLASASVANDVFGYLSSGALALEKLAWTGATTRATAITIQDGRYCKSGDKTRLYLGTFHPTTTTVTEDSATKRFVWNMYNRAARSLTVTDTTDSWSYTTGTWRQARAAASNKVEYVVGLAEDEVNASLHGTVALANNSAREAMVAIGVDSTTAPSGRWQGGFSAASVTFFSPINGAYRGIPGVGYHYLVWLEYGADGTSTFLGDNGGSQSNGLLATVWG